MAAHLKIKKKTKENMGGTLKISDNRLVKIDTKNFKFNYNYKVLKRDGINRS